MSIPSTVIQTMIGATEKWHQLFLRDRVRPVLDPTAANSIEVFIYELKMRRWGMLSQDDHVQSLWEKIMPVATIDLDSPTIEVPVVNEHLIDYILNGAAYVQLICAVPSGHMDQVLGEITAAICWPHRAKLIGGELKERSAEPAFIKKAFAENAWLLFCYLLTISDLDYNGSTFNPTLSPEKVGDDENDK